MDRSMAVAQAASDPDVAEIVRRRWMRELASAPVAAFPVNGQMRADQAEIAAPASALHSHAAAASLWQADRPVLHSAR